ncbi:hypothetical protein K504DRAFT_489436 [Pleomassaria siparia CBS 279.74]|uniref:Uncharacterized protein n=1 Tax=Pleomassaria siparia CBS 279.74 TaxID=1314801 RepID=A0A6G1KGB2_9PLEO|nr:hypothetical protein K504DRAFT_489436 [Pleomassaria siparia CBS 279.74]
MSSNSVQSTPSVSSPEEDASPREQYQKLTTIRIGYGRMIQATLHELAEKEYMLYQRNMLTESVAKLNETRRTAIKNAKAHLRDATVFLQAFLSTNSVSWLRLAGQEIFKAEVCRRDDPDFTRERALKHIIMSSSFNHAGICPLSSTEAEQAALRKKYNDILTVRIGYRYMLRAALTELHHKEQELPLEEDPAALWSRSICTARKKCEAAVNYLRMPIGLGQRERPIDMIGWIALVEREVHEVERMFEGFMDADRERALLMGMRYRRDDGTACQSRGYSKGQRAFRQDDLTTTTTTIGKFDENKFTKWDEKEADKVNEEYRVT